MSDPRSGAISTRIKVIWCLPDGTRQNQTVADLDSLMMLLRDPAGVTIDSAAYQVSHSQLILKNRQLTATVHLTV